MKAFVSLVLFALLLVVLGLVIPAHSDSITNGQMQLAEKAKNVVADIFGAEMTYHSVHGYNVYGNFSDLQNQRLINPGYTPTNMVEGYEIHIMMSEFIADGDRPLIMALPVTSETEDLVGFVAYHNSFSKSFNDGPVLNTLACLLPLDLITDQDKDELTTPLQAMVDRVEDGETLTRADRNTILYTENGENLLFYSKQGTSTIYFRGVIYLIVPLEDAAGDGLSPIYEQTELARWLMDQTAQSRAKGWLRSFGSAQLAYQGTHEENVYGYFADLQNDLYIPRGYTPENIEEGYTFHFFLTEDRKHFLIVAGGGIEHTSLAITDDQVLLELSPIDVSELDMSKCVNYTKGSDNAGGGFNWAYFYKADDEIGKYYMMFSGVALTAVSCYEDTFSNSSYIGIGAPAEVTTVH